MEQESKTTKSLPVTISKKGGKIIVQGRQGEPGKDSIVPGPKGEPGRDGVDGKNGKDGVKGKDGLNGKDGKNGINGKNGLDGKNGIDGLDGSPDTREEIIDKIKNEKKWIKPGALTEEVVSELRQGLGRNSGGGSNSLRLLTDVNLDAVPQDSKGNYILGGGSLSETFETVSKNLKSYPPTFAYTGDVLNTITYDLGGGLSIVKTFNYTGDILNTIVLSGDTPSGISLTKTFGYTGTNLTTITYS